jgi:16S rRNA (cytidine1402-2'-O)-methyltransferase
MAATGRLYIVATPIGNLGDVSARARDILQSVDLLAAEDTRVTRKLLDRFQIRARMISYREANEVRAASKLVEHLEAGRSVALVTDAGTPCISDPGYRLVSAAAEAGIEIVSVPGPSSVIALLSVSGLPTDRFSFEGFAPTKKAALRDALATLRGCGRTVVFFESPRRVVALVREIADALSDPEVAVGRELTKLHEEVLRGNASQISTEIEKKVPRGEFAVAVSIPANRSEHVDGEAARSEIERLLDGGLSPRDIATVLKPAGVSRSTVYAIAAERPTSDE